MTASASASVRFLMPCRVRKWNLTHGALVVLVVEAEGVAAEAVHMAERGRNAARTHRDRHLVERFREERPKIPVVVGTSHAGARIAFDGVVQVGEFQRIAQEEDRRVVAYQVPVARVGVEFHGEAPDVALGIGGAALSGYGREADQTVGLFTHLRKDRGPGVFGDVVRHGEGPESSRSFGVHAAFGDHFPVEMGEFFEIPYVLQHGGAAHAGGLDVLVVGNGFPVFGGQSFLVHILLFFVGMQKMPDRFMIEFHIVVIQSKNIAIRIGVASLGICFFCEERTVGVNFSGNRLCFSRIWKISLYLSR